MNYCLERFSILMNIGIFCIDVSENKLYSFQEHAEFNVIAQNEELRKRLMSGADNQMEPFIYKDKFEVYFAGIKVQNKYYLIGPMSLKLMDIVEQRRYYREYGMDRDIEKCPAHFTVSEMLYIVEFIANILTREEYTDDELIHANHMIRETRDQEEQEQLLFDMQEEEKERYHHTYLEERKLLDKIREGCSEDALKYSRNMDANLGKLSAKELNHWKNTAIVAVTLCTRAAIEGGVSPANAYRISDFYIQKSDMSGDIAQIIKYRDHAIQELTEQVKRKKSRKTSNYAEQCRSYVEKNYRKKIYLSDIAESLGLSESYLSRLFKKETGGRLQDYIIDVRLEHAVNLLKYSEEPISNIAEYVNFSSQSYMGKVFREKYHMSPKQYRKNNSPSEYYHTK